MEIRETTTSPSPLVNGQIKGKPQTMLSPGAVQRLILQKPLDIAIARTTVRKLADSLGYSLIDQVRLSSAVFEIADNIVACAGRGEIVISWYEDAKHKGLQLFCNDQGLHAPKLTTILQTDGCNPEYRSSMELKQLVDEFEFKEDEKHGNCVTIALWLEQTD